MNPGSHNPYDQISKSIEPISLQDMETKIPERQKNDKDVKTCDSPQIDERIFDFPLWALLDDTSEQCTISNENIAKSDFESSTLSPPSSQSCNSRSSNMSNQKRRRRTIASPSSTASHFNHATETTPPSTLIPMDAIRRYDVLSGRGNGVGQHIGNIEFRSIIHAHAEAYRSTMDLNKKLLIVADIKNKVETVHRGRFLTHVDDGVGMYRLLNLTEVRQKIQQALRDNSKKSKIKS